MRYIQVHQHTPGYDAQRPNSSPVDSCLILPSRTLNSTNFVFVAIPVDKAINSTARLLLQRRLCQLQTGGPPDDSSLVDDYLCLSPGPGQRYGVSWAYPARIELGALGDWCLHLWSDRQGDLVSRTVSQNIHSCQLLGQQVAIAKVSLLTA